MLRCSIFLLLAVLQLSQAAIREPWVENLASFFDKDDCMKIVEVAESVGFQNDSDSIDYNDPRATVSWQIDIVLEQMIEVPELAHAYDKYLPRLRDLVADRKFKMNNGDTSEPTLDWVFLRKYSASGERKMLKLHHDINLFTVNVGLNDDFEGGGLFYHKNKDEYFESGNNLPEFPEDKLNYEFLDDLKRKNTSEIVFPSQGQGDLLIHNNTLFHAIAPIEKGTRYSLIFFYDMHHPDVKRFHQNPVPVRIHNLFDFPVDLYEVDSETAEYARVVVMEELEKEFFIECIASHHYEIVDRESNNVVYEFTVLDDKEEGEEHVVVVGPEDEDLEEEDEREEDDRRAIIENKFTYPVTFMWINFDEEGNRDPHIIDEVMEERTELNSVLGHEFIVVNKETEEIVHTFQVADQDEDGGTEGEFHITVGPHKQRSADEEL